ncbi:hypothetical protein [Mammaliicoccus sciuri]|uniref:hypothetical protein n=1 Tax=Mammaliicoccus sciuri TaxID=1296 RepID=UPI001951D19D|nr:hypothetical protein [Mammaliicoccus sciuri]
MNLSKERMEQLKKALNQQEKALNNHLIEKCITVSGLDIFNQVEIENIYNNLDSVIVSFNFSDGTSKIATLDVNSVFLEN